MSKQKTNFCTQFVLSLYFSGEFNGQSLVILWVNKTLLLLSLLTDARMRASEKDLPVENLSFYKQIPSQYVNVAQLVEVAIR